MGRLDEVTGSIFRPGAIPGAVNQGIYEQSVTKRARLGSRMPMHDSRVFYYCKNSSAAALAPGKMIGAVCAKTERTDTITEAASAGAKKVKIVAVGDITADSYAEGYLVFADETGYGPTHKIAGNDAILNTAEGYVYLYDGLFADITTALDVYITQSPFTDVIQTPDVSIFVIGTPLITVTESYYFWCQTWGPAAVLCGDSTGAGATERECSVDSTTGEVLTTATGVAGNQVVAHCLLDSADGIDTEFNIVMLCCIP